MTRQSAGLAHGRPILAGCFQQKHDVEIVLLSVSYYVREVVYHLIANAKGVGRGPDTWNPMFLPSS